VNYLTDSAASLAVLSLCEPQPRVCQLEKSLARKESIMFNPYKVQTSELQKKIQQAIQNVETNIAEDSFIKTLSDNITALGVSNLVGTIDHAGQDSSGRNGVGFLVGSQGWSSSWPQWAFDLVSRF
jgi:hypothetical protein